MHWTSSEDEKSYGAADDAGNVDGSDSMPDGPDELASDLAERYWDRLRYFAMRLLRDAALAEDVAQESLRRTLEALREGRVENTDALASFVFQTARHVCMHRTESAGREARAFQALKATRPQATSPEEGPLFALISRERRAEVRRAFQRLPAPDRDLLRMTYGEGLDTQEIARRLGLTEGAVRVRRHRAISRLGAFFGVTKKPKPGP
jgi:RNA polymerase sigma-70 factor (ECF subfamily)